MEQTIEDYAKVMVETFNLQDVGTDFVVMFIAKSGENLVFKKSELERRLRINELITNHGQLY